MGTQTPVQYEQLVEKLFSKELERHVDLQDCRIFHDKQYFGKSGHQHQIDVSAEFKIAGVKFLVILECKQYARSVGIKDVMVLAARIDDIGANKGVLVTTKGFQAGAVKIAQSRRIALVTACDLGWRPCLEDSAEEMRRQQEFSTIANTFLRWYLGPRAQREEVACAVERIAKFDIISAFGVKPCPLGSLRYGRGSIQLPPSVHDVSAQHGFVVEGGGSQIILDTRGLLALLALGGEGQSTSDRPASPARRMKQASPTDPDARASRPRASS